MADIQVTCGECSAANVFSEYSDPASRTCRHCGRPLETRAEENPEHGGLRVRGRTRRDPPPLPAETPPCDVPVAGRAPPVSGKGRAGGIGRWGFLLSLLFFSALLVAPQAFLARYPALEPVYLPGRFAALAAVALMILVDAFRDSAAQGLLCLFAPLYVVYYSLSRVESYWRQGIVVAVLLMIGAELFFLPERAMVTGFRDWTSDRIESVSRAIRWAGDGGF